MATLGLNFLTSVIDEGEKHYEDMRDKVFQLN